jgi:hypothetical protein
VEGSAAAAVVGVVLEASAAEGLAAAAPGAVGKFF